MSEKLLDRINYPSDLRLLKKNQLEQVTRELRSEQFMRIISLAPEVL